MPLARAALRYLLSWLWFMPALACAYFAGAAQRRVDRRWPWRSACLAMRRSARLNPQRQYSHDLLCGTRLVYVAHAEAQPTLRRRREGCGSVHNGWPDEPRNSACPRPTRTRAPSRCASTAAPGRAIHRPSRQRRARPASLDRPRGWQLVYGGGRAGLMGEVADAALAAGARVVGVIPQSLMDREVGHRA